MSQRTSFHANLPSSLTSTARVRLPAGPHTAALDAMGVAWGRAERALHAEMVGLGDASVEQMNALKVRFMAEHGITSRYHNSLLFGLKGAYASLRACHQLNLDDLEAKRAARVAKRDAWAKRLEKHDKAEAGIAGRAVKGKPPTRAQRKALLSEVDVAVGREAVFRHARVAHRLGQKAERSRAEMARPIPSVVFGGVKRLRERGRLAADAAVRGDALSTELAAWRAGWDAARSSEIFAMGSSDETLGNQSCAFVVDPATGVGTLRLRGLRKEDGHVVIPGVRLNDHARRVLARWLTATQAPRGKTGRAPKAPKISFRFVRTVPGDAKEAARFEGPNARFSPWEVCITVEEAVPVVTPCADSEGLVLGVDLNGDHLACALCTLDGNPLSTGVGLARAGVGLSDTGDEGGPRCGGPLASVVPRASGSGFWVIPMPLDGLDAQQRAAVMGDAVAQAVALAVALGARLAIEALDFGRRKQEMQVRPGSARRNRALSALPYAALHALLTRAAARAGVAVREVNPAYTSVVGRVKVAPMRGVSTHQGAALAIARRALGLKEHYKQRHARGSDRPALTAAEQEGGTSWKVWGRVHGILRRHDAQVWSRRGEETVERPGGLHGPHPVRGGASAWSGGDGVPGFPAPSPTGRHAEQLFAAEARGLA